MRESKRLKRHEPELVATACSMVFFIAMFALELLQRRGYLSVSERVHEICMVAALAFGVGGAFVAVVELIRRRDSTAWLVAVVTCGWVLSLGLFGAMMLIP